MFYECKFPGVELMVLNRLAFYEMQADMLKPLNSPINQANRYKYIGKPNHIWPILSRLANVAPKADYILRFGYNGSPDRLLDTQEQKHLHAAIQPYSSHLGLIILSLLFDIYFMMFPFLLILTPFHLHFCSLSSLLPRPAFP
jgi:hypothetical protein